MFQSFIVSHPDSFTVDIDRIESIFANIDTAVDIPQNGTINIGFLTDNEIQSLNHQYRGINSTTDVLSFHYFETFDTLNADDVAWEIIMSESRILSQADEHEHSPWIEFEILVIHGILHILGFDHETDEEYQEMWRHEEPLRALLW